MLKMNYVKFENICNKFKGSSSSQQPPKSSSEVNFQQIVITKEQCPLSCLPSLLLRHCSILEGTVLGGTSAYIVQSCKNAF